MGLAPVAAPKGLIQAAHGHIGMTAAPIGIGVQQRPLIEAHRLQPCGVLQHEPEEVKRLVTTEFCFTAEPEKRGHIPFGEGRGSHPQTP
jgi:hypothetical protein